MAGDADLDTSYHLDGWSAMDMSVYSDTAYGVAIQADGRIVEVGCSPNGSDLDFAATRRAVNGNVDMTLGGDGKVFVDFGYGDDVARDVVIEPGGNIIVVGSATYAGKVSFGIVRLDLLSGTVLDSQVVAFTYASEANAVALQPDGKIVVAGTTFNGVDLDLAVARLNSNLTLDSSFSGDGKYTLNTGGDVEIWDVAVESDGNLILVGSGYSIDRVKFYVQRLNSVGDPVSGWFHQFDDDAAAHAVALQPDGKVVAVGTCESNYGDMAVIRMNSGLSLDSSFSGDGKDVQHFSFGRDEAWDVAIQPDGRVVVAGWLSRDGGLQELALLRYTNDGTLDPNLGGNGYASASYGGSDTYGRALDLQSDGKMVVGAYSTTAATDLFLTARFMGDESQVFVDAFEWSDTEPWSNAVP